MRKWLLRIHLYGGLLCAPYLVLFGFSSLQFHYHFPLPKPPPTPRHWEADLAIPTIRDNDALAQAVRDSLGLAGWTLPWKTRRDAAGDLQFDLERPGKSYTITTVSADRKVRVEERNKGFWQVVNALHAMGRIPGSTWSAWWRIYTEICTAFVAFASVSGLYLWLNSQRERRIGALALLAAGMGSVAFILFIVFWG